MLRSVAELRAFDGTLLKVPKCEIFDLSGFHDFYTIKSQREGGGRLCCQNKKMYICIFCVVLLRPFVSVNNDFIKFLLF
jgi:hypothetical protein